MAGVGFTRARSMGPVAEAVTRAGGDVARVFRKADLPLRLIETPDQLILLKDQLAVVEYAARELDDEALPLRLSLQAGTAGLGAFGAHVRAAPDLCEAIARCNRGIDGMLQSMTQMRLAVVGDTAIWSYEVTDGARIGREKNELLAFGYMADTLRRFGAGAPLRAVLPTAPARRVMLETLLGCDFARGARAALMFPASVLEGGPAIAAPDDGCAETPLAADFVAGVEHLVNLALLDRRPTLDYVGRHLAISPRSLQRRLGARGESFEALRQRVVMARAQALLATTASITDIAYELGYSDPAHFSRAYGKWAGRSPRAARRLLADTPRRLASTAAKP